MQEQDGTLAGLRVIDCGTYIAGPAAATVMSDFGADVVKIERPEGSDLWRLWWIIPVVQLDPDHEFPRLCQGLGAPELATNPMFATVESRTQNAAELYAILQSQFESRDLSELRVIFREHDIKWSTWPTIEEVVSDAQVRNCGALVDLDLPGGGQIQTINSPVFISGAKKRAPTSAPEVGAHTREIMRELGYSDESIDAMVERGTLATWHHTTSNHGSLESPHDVGAGTAMRWEDSWVAGCVRF